MKRILIVEDEAIVAMQTGKHLSRAGYEVAAALSSGEEAIERFEELKPELVLMDITLRGELDGISTAALLKEKYDVPVIFLTAHTEGNILERAKVTGPYGYIVKPFDMKTLDITVGMALYKHELDMEKDRLTRELKDSMEKVKLLSGLLPICCSCKKIKDDKGYWEQVEVYVSEHSEAEFSHALCPECIKKIYPKQYERIKRPDWE